jgi:hypothetical protein
MAKLNPVEPPWYGPVCPVVWEGWHREVSPYPNLRRNLAVGGGRDEGPASTRLSHSGSDWHRPDRAVSGHPATAGYPRPNLQAAIRASRLPNAMVGLTVLVIS